ncbi:iron uptake system component EfeO [Mesorhizobium soli]|uniref:iron uptake system protein EfeO n=1 Tax=Pseudaminobacter soli (ex Li et al. 2025) TaxID=1295366 RepID=UPI0024766391|nr:iron uptake system protein EfeO [Mesorhizobium soli]MDH6234549.1 iron uptake system component EfeO [Mesorhizobium soli]
MPRTNPATWMLFATTASAAFITSAISPGAAAQGKSAAPVENGASQVRITLTADNGNSCALDHATAKAGPITFTVTNKTSTAITEVELMSNNRILGEKENLAPGLPSVGFTLALGGGTYQVYCPGAAQEMQSFTVVGKATAAPSRRIADILATGTKDYAGYVDGVVDAMLISVQRLKADIDTGDLERAKANYAKARPFYERIESDVGGFVLPGFKPTDNAGNLDYLIDMRASNLDDKVGWHGFHAIERELFQENKITHGTKALAAELEKNVAQLDRLVKTLSYKPEDLANGAAGLLEEVQRNKVTGEEEAFSHYDLGTLAGNVEGAEQAFAFLEPGLEKIDPDLARQVGAQFLNVKTLLDTYRDSSVPGGYKAYTVELKASDGPKLSKTVLALQEPLSKIAEKVAQAY